MKFIFNPKIIQAAIGLTFIGGLFSSCKPTQSADSHSSSQQSARAAVKVQTAVLKSELVPVFEEVVGTVRPHLQAKVSAKVTGRLLSMKAVPGMKVKKGTVIAEIEIEELKAALERARAAYKNSDSDLQRYHKLLASGAATQAEFDAVQSRQLIASATVKETQAMISNATVKAPFDGTITRKLMDTGDLATPGKPLFIIEDSTQLRLEINVAESLANQVTLGEKFQLLITGASSTELSGTVAEIAPSADSGSRTFMVKLTLQQNPALRAGQFGRAYLPRAKRDALMVPSKAVIERGQMDYVFIADQDIARLRIVRTRDQNRHSKSPAKTREILAGLENGEKVILSPAPELRDGQKIITDAAPNSSKSSSQN